MFTSLSMVLAVRLRRPPVCALEPGSPHSCRRRERTGANGCVRRSRLAEPDVLAAASVGSQVSPLLSMWRVGLADWAATSLAHGRRGQYLYLVGAGGADCGGEELITLSGRGTARQVDQREAGGLVRGGV